jgi:hypothetical protein
MSQVSHAESRKDSGDLGLEVFVLPNGGVGYGTGGEMVADTTGVPGGRVEGDRWQHLVVSVEGQVRARTGLISTSI